MWIIVACLGVIAVWVFAIGPIFEKRRKSKQAMKRLAEQASDDRSREHLEELWKLPPALGRYSPSSSTSDTSSSCDSGSSGGDSSF